MCLTTFAKKKTNQTKTKRQLLSALKLLYHANIIHTDLKPENILLDNDNDWKVRVIDFGSATLENVQTYSYIQSRFYRAPEVILGHGLFVCLFSFFCCLLVLFFLNCVFLCVHNLRPKGKI